LLSVVSNSLVLIGCIILLVSLAVVRRIARQLPAGRSCKSWCAMSALIVLFVIGYLAYLATFWDQHTAIVDLIVPGIFFFGACFVWFSTYIALQTTLDVMRISDLEHETLTDPLTGVYNRRFMEQRLAEEISKARRYCFQLSILLFDLDHFKRVNDEQGHQAGDRMLIEICELVKDQLRDSDLLSRYGGEEFLVIAPNTGPSEAALLAERLRTCVESTAFLKEHEELGGNGLRTTISIGIASFDDDSTNAETLIGEADRNLYQAKGEGRNRAIGGYDTQTNAGITGIASQAS
jgi:diguanylate cyclase (GGDEF)-like protein